MASSVGQLLSKMNPTTLSGAIDVLVIQQPDGTLRASPFHARFGKMRVLRPKDDLVDLYVNGELIVGLETRLGPAGDVHFPEGSASPATPRTQRSLDEECNSSTGSSGGGGSGDSLFDWFLNQMPRKPEESRPAMMASASSSRISLNLANDLEDKIVPAAAARQQSIRLSSEQLRRLRLRPGSNSLRYQVNSSYLGSSYCECAVYLWRHDDKLVVSDIDGTITRSDLLGHLLPMVGGDWTQPMVAPLFSAVQRNGYRFVYLSSRGLGQSRATRQFLRQVNQNGSQLPEGPVLLSPENLMSAFHREVIARRPQEFKIPCLQAVCSLFPPCDLQSSGGPIWAGFGNRPSDAATYAKVGVPPSRCFTVNSRGELIVEGGAELGAGATADCGEHSPIVTATSYQELAEVADTVFPACRRAAKPPPRLSVVDDSDGDIESGGDASAEKLRRQRRRRSLLLAMWLSESNLYL